MQPKEPVDASYMQVKSVKKADKAYLLQVEAQGTLFMKHSVGEMTSKTNEDPRSGQGTSRGRDSIQKDSKNSSVVNLKII